MPVVQGMLRPMQNWFRVFAEEWPVIKEAPWSFAVCVVIAAGLIWFAMEWFHRRTSAGKDAEIASKKAEIELLVRQRDHAMVKPAEPVAPLPISHMPSSVAIEQSSTRRDSAENEPRASSAAAQSPPSQAIHQVGPAQTTSKDLAFFHSIVTHNNAVVARNLLRPYVGLNLNYKAPLNNIVSSPEIITLALDLGPGSILICQYPVEFSDYIARLDVGTSVTGVGTITNQTVGKNLVLAHCRPSI